MSDNALILNFTGKDKSADFIFKYLSLLENTEYLLKSNISVLTALNFLSQSFDNNNNELDFLSLNDTDQTSVINILLSLTHAVDNIYQNEKDQSILKENDNYLNDITQTLFVLSTKSDEFIHQFNSTSDKCIDSILTLIDTLTNLNRIDKAISAPLQSLLNVLISMSKFHLIFEKNWINTKKMLDNLKKRLKYFDQEIDTKWLTFIILYNLQAAQSFIDSSFDFLNNNKNNEQALKIGLNFLEYLETEDGIYESNILGDFLDFIYCIDKENSLLNIDRKKIVDFYFKYLSQNLNRLIEFIEEFNKDKNNQEIKSKIEIKIDVIKIITRNLTHFSDSSIEYSTVFHQNKNCLETLFSFIDNESLIDFNDDNFTYSLNDVFDNVICTLYNLSRLQPKFLEEWNAQNPVDKSLKFLEKAGKDFKLMIYVLIANVANDDQIKTLPELKNAIEEISNIIKECADNLDSDQTVIRNKVIKQIFFLSATKLKSILIKNVFLLKIRLLYFFKY